MPVNSLINLIWLLIAPFSFEQLFTFKCKQFKNYNNNLLDEGMFLTQ